METPSLPEAPRVVGEIRIQIVQQGTAIQIGVASTLDLLTGLGLLESAKDVLKQQATGPAPSSLVVARGNVPRLS